MLQEAAASTLFVLKFHIACQIPARQFLFDYRRGIKKWEIEFNSTPDPNHGSQAISSNINLREQILSYRARALGIFARIQSSGTWINVCWVAFGSRQVTRNLARDCFGLAIRRASPLGQQNHLAQKTNMADDFRSFCQDKLIEKMKERRGQATSVLQV